MLELPQITILLITYKRLAEIRKTIDALRRHLVYPKDKITWLIADDNSGDGYLDDIISTPRYKTIAFETSITEQNCGWGCNVNKALRAVNTEFVFMIEDDYLLMKPLDLRVGVALLAVKPHIGMLRYRGSAGTALVYHQMEADISPYVPDYQDGVGLPGKLNYFLIDGGSPDLYIYSHGAHLKRTSFHQFYGAYPEGLKLGVTEEAYAHVVKDGMMIPNAPAIAFLPDFVNMWFDHIGESRQLTEHDKGAG